MGTAKTQWGNGKITGIEYRKFYLNIQFKQQTKSFFNDYVYKSSCVMKKASKHYKFINNETDNVIYFLSVPKDSLDDKKVLEDTKHKLAIQNGIYIGNIYYIEIPETEVHE